MRNIVVWVLLFVACLPIVSQARQVININKDWKFNKGMNSTNGLKTISLPHTWNTEGVVLQESELTGTGNYLKEVMISEEWRNKRLFIRFGGVATIANLFINGRYVGEHRGAFTSFTFEITPFVRYGELNSIVINVNNSSQIDILPINGDMNIYGGIYRDVELIVTDKNMISLADYGSDGVYVTQTSVSESVADIDTKVLIDGIPNTKIKVSVDVSDGKSVVASSVEDIAIDDNGDAEVQINMPISSPRLWNGVNDPFLYKVVVNISDQDGGGDCVTVPLGLRYFSVDREQGFMLNGKPYKLNGVNIFQDRSVVGGALMKQHYEEDIDLITEMGATAVRTAYVPAYSYVYSLLDREGLVAWCDFPLIGGDLFANKGFVDSRSLKENGETQFIEMIRQLYNHPSIFFWGLFSDITTRGDNPMLFIQSLNNIAKQESPDRLTVASSNEDGPINFITDLIAWSQSFGWKGGDVSDINKWLSAFETDWKDIKPGISEYGAGANIIHQSDSMLKPNINGDKHYENWQTFFHESYYKSIHDKKFLWGTFIASMFDHGSLIRKAGEMPGLNGNGLITFDRHAKKDAFYFYKANWNDIEPFVYIAEKRNRTRYGKVHNVKVFTNLEDVELFVNGQSKGVVKPVLGTAVWNNVDFSNKNNEIRAVSGRYKDIVNIEVSGGLLAQ